MVYETIEGPPDKAPLHYLQIQQEIVFAYRQFLYKKYCENLIANIVQP
jgi:hypothetical protein